jgi:WD40 repeat protein
VFQTKSRLLVTSIFIAGKAGSIHVWTYTYKELLKLSYSYPGDPSLSKIKSMDCTGDGRKIIFGTFDSRIVEMVSTDMMLSQNSKYTKSDINKGPFTPDSVDSYEMWGLAVFRSPDKKDRFLTCSDNGCIEMWSTSQFERMSSMTLGTNENVKELANPDDRKLRCISIATGEETVLVGCKSGLIQVVWL